LKASIAFYLGLAVLLALSWFVLFFQLDAFPIRLWDESRLAVNAVEMLQDHDYMSTHYGHAPEHWNTKPPLMIWSQVFWMKLLGPTELAVRLPSALSVLFMVLLVYVYFYRSRGEIYTGLFSGIILLTNHGIIETHISRTGDYDAMLCLWMLLYLFCFYRYAEAGKEARKYLLLGALFLFLAFMTKSIAAFIPMPAVACYFVLRGRLKMIFTEPYFYLSALLLIAGVVSYYFFREQHDPGYVKAALENDALGRFKGNITDNVHKGDKLTYLTYFAEQFAYWIYFIPLALIMIPQLEKSKRNLMLYLLAVVVSSLFFLSQSQTKMPWYIAPYVAVSCVVLGIGLSAFAEQVLKKLSFKFHQLAVLAFMIIVFCFPVKEFVHWAYSYKNPGFWQEEQMKAGALMKKIPIKDTYVVYHHDYNSNIDFYTEAMRYQGAKVSRVYQVDALRKGENVLIISSRELALTDSLYQIDTLQSLDGAYYLCLKDYK